MFNRLVRHNFASLKIVGAIIYIYILSSVVMGKFLCIKSAKVRVASRALGFEQAAELRDLILKLEDHL